MPDFATWSPPRSAREPACRAPAREPGGQKSFETWEYRSTRTWRRRARRTPRREARSDPAAGAAPQRRSGLARLQCLMPLRLGAPTTLGTAYAKRRPPRPHRTPAAQGAPRRTPVTRETLPHAWRRRTPVASARRPAAPHPRHARDAAARRRTPSARETLPHARRKTPRARRSRRTPVATATRKTLQGAWQLFSVLTKREEKFHFAEAFRGLPWQLFSVLTKKSVAIWSKPKKLASHGPKSRF